jgi:ferredoxin-NADP reductase
MHVYSPKLLTGEAVSVSVSPATALSAPGVLRRVLATWVDPATFDFWAGMVHPTWSWDRPLAQVVARHVEAQDTVTLELQPNRHCGSFLPGQHINVSAEVNGRRTTRSYSVTTVPCRDRRLSITVKRVENGTLSTHLCRYIQVGDVLEIGPAFGSMVLPEALQGRWLFLAAGSGITPMMALTRSLAQRQMPVPLTLVYWVKKRAELCFLRELQKLAQMHSHFSLRVVLTEEAQLLAGEHQGLISGLQLQQLAGDVSQCQVFACGPSGFVETARQLVAPHAALFLAEGFTPAARVQSDTALPATVRLRLTHSQRELEISTTTSLLDALEAQGIRPDSGCRMGVCQTCVCTRIQGTTQDMLNGERSDESDMNVRLCVSRAGSDLALAL